MVGHKQTLDKRHVNNVQRDIAPPNLNRAQHAQSVHFQIWKVKRRVRLVLMDTHNHQRDSRIAMRVNPDYLVLVQSNQHVSNVLLERLPVLQRQ
tara:strand:- start:76 stop:357 length:282 start_codon:yes stop_codon:yes gene_type:complete